jgi:hypothetical protein
MLSALVLTSMFMATSEDEVNVLKETVAKAARTTVRFHCMLWVGPGIVLQHVEINGFVVDLAQKKTLSPKGAN